MAGGLPSTQSAMPITSEHVDDGGMSRDLIIRQPSGSEVSDCTASYESQGPSTRKRNSEEGGGTVDRPLDRIQPADKIKGTIIDRDANEIDDDYQDSDGPSKRSRRLGISGGSVGMSASHEAEIHGVDISVYRADS